MKTVLGSGRGSRGARIASVVVWMGMGLAGCGHGAGYLKAAIDSRTEVTVLQQDCAQQNAEVRDIMCKVVAKGEAKATEGNLLLAKNRYDEAVAAFKESAGLYRQVIGWRELLTRLVDAERAAAGARVLAEAAVPPGKLTNARKLQVNAEACLQAGEFEAAVAKLVKVHAAFSALLPAAGEATLETAIAARMAMFAARAQIKGLGTLEADEDDNGLSDLKRRLLVGRSGGGDAAQGQPAKPGSTADLVGRATIVERAASRALEDRQYTPARALFAAAAKFYSDLATLQAKRDAMIAARQSVEQDRKLAAAAFKGNARPASFERGKQALGDADKALAGDDFQTARKHLAAAAERFAVARAEAPEQNAAAEAQQTWTAALAAADADLLDRHASAAAKAAKDKAAEAQGKWAGGDPKAAATAWTAAVAGLKAAVAASLTKENQGKATPVLQRLDAAIAAKNKFAAEDVLAELEQLIPDDARMPGLRDKVAALPGLKQALTVNLGSGVSMEFVLVRPGSFLMGSETGDAKGKPVHKVTLTKPFYIGKYEVTQEQWQAVTGANPSFPQGPKLPVTDVNWEDCLQFAAKLAAGGRGAAGVFRLPTEAEWEYACRAGSTTAFCFGDNEEDLGEYAWFGGNCGSKTHEVGTRKPNAWGLYDMHGNVWEWCSDWYGAYTSGAATDPEGPAQGSARVDRGGSWLFGARDCRSAFRGTPHPLSHGYMLGCRIVLAPPGSPQDVAVDAKKSWTDALAGTDTAMLDRHAAAATKAAKTKAADAEGYLAAGDPKAAATAWTDAVAGLKAAVAAALIQDNQAKAVPVLARLEAAIAAKNKFAAEDVLAELEQIIPDDGRMPGLRDNVAAMPGRSKKTLSVNLGGGVSMEFVLIRPGSFQMGSETGASNEKPVHKVTLTKPFYIGKYKVTQEQWQAVMGTNPTDGGWGLKRPVADVSWEDCRQFMVKLAEGERGAVGVFRLPTEAEWEYACRAGTTTAFSFGNNKADLGEYAWFFGNSDTTGHNVGMKKPNAWGLYDLHGSISEWCSDSYGAYTAEAATDPERSAESSEKVPLRVWRGGCWQVENYDCRSACRHIGHPGDRYATVGCRVVLAPPVQE